MTITADHRGAIRRAIALLDAASPADLAGWLARTAIRDSLKADPGFLRDRLAEVLAERRAPSPPGLVLSAGEVSRQLLAAAGLPY